MIAVTIHVDCLLQREETFVTAAAGVVTPSHHRRSPRRDRGDVARHGREADRRPDRAPRLPSESTHGIMRSPALSSTDWDTNGRGVIGGATAAAGIGLIVRGAIRGRNHAEPLFRRSIRARRGGRGTIRRGSGRGLIQISARGPE